MNINDRFYFILGKEGYVSKNNQSTMVAGYKFLFLFPSSSGYEYFSFSFRNMTHMHKGYACKIFKSGCLEDYKLISQNKNNISKIQNKVTCRGIEP